MTHACPTRRSSDLGVYPHLLHNACCCFCCVGCKMNICDEGYPVAPTVKFFLNMSQILCLADAWSCYTKVFAAGFHHPDGLFHRPASMHGIGGGNRLNTNGLVYTNRYISDLNFQFDKALIASTESTI